MKGSRIFAGSAVALLALVALGCLGTSHPAAAQHYEGCYVNGQQVPDSECQGGGGGGGYTGGSGGCNVICQGLRNLIWGSPGPSPAQSAHNRSNALHEQATKLYYQGNYPAALDLYHQAMDADPSNDGAAGDYWALKAKMDRDAGNLDLALSDIQRAVPHAAAGYTGYNDIQREIEQAIAARQADAKVQFAKGQQDLLNQIHPVGNASFALQPGDIGEAQTDHGGLRVLHAADLNPRSIDKPEDKGKKDAGPTTLKVLNQTAAYVTVSVDGGYGCNTAGGTTCTIPVTKGHHQLRAVRADTGAAFSEAVDVPAGGYTWPLSGN